VLPAAPSSKCCDSRDAFPPSAPSRLTYWVVFSAFSIVEIFTDVILFWFPFYYTLKIFFLVWLQHPSTRGAEYLYRNFLRAQFLRLGALFENFVTDPSRVGGLSATGARMVGRDGLGAASAMAATSGRPPLTAVSRGAPSTADPALLFGEGAGGGARHVD
jgi:hypothetical protein